MKNSNSITGNRRFIAEMMRMYNEKPSVKAFTEIILTLFAISIFSLFAIRPTLSTIGKLNGEIVQKADTVAKLDSKIEALSQAQSNYSRLNQELKLLNMYVPQSPQIARVAKIWEEMASQNEVVMTQMTIDPVALKQLEQAQLPQLTSISLSVRFEGDYENLYSLISEKSNIGWPLRVSESQLKTNEDDGAQTMALQLSGDMPYFIK